MYPYHWVKCLSLLLIYKSQAVKQTEITRQSRLDQEVNERSVTKYNLSFLDVLVTCFEFRSFYCFIPHQKRYQSTQVINRMLIMKQVILTGSRCFSFSFWSKAGRCCTKFMLISKIEINFLLKHQLEVLDSVKNVTKSLSFISMSNHDLKKLTYLVIFILRTTYSSFLAQLLRQPVSH